MSIEDPIIELARGNASDTLDAGLVITRATSNVAVAYRGDEGELAIGYTQSGASDADVVPVSDGGLDVRVYGNLFANNLTTTANVDASYINGNVVTSNLTVSGNYTMGGHIIPDTNDVYDIGSAEKKIRDIYVSDNSLWVGDETKISFSEGKMRFRKRKMDVVPAAILTAGGTSAGAKSFAGKTDLNDIKIHEWLKYMKTLSGKSNAKMSDVFRDNKDDYEATTAAEAWKDMNDEIYTTSNVSVGKTTSPTVRLDVEGDGKFSGNVVTTGNIGISKTTPDANLHVVGHQYVNDPPTLANSFDHSDAPLTLTHGTPTSTTAVDDPKAVLHLTRDGTSGESYGARASFNLSRYENSGTASRSRLDVALTDGTYAESNVMSIRADGRVGIGTTTPGYTLDVRGTANVGALTATSISGPLSGNATTATALETARTIGGVSFDGSGNIDLPGVNTSGNQDTTGNADTATALETARTIGGVSFDGTANIDLPGVNTTGNQNTSGNAATATTATNQSGGTVNATTGTFSGDVEVTGELTTKSNVFLGVMKAFGSEGTLEFGRADGTDRVHNIKVYNSSTQTDNYMKFQIHAGGATAGTVTDNVLYLRGDGNVGIGTASPSGFDIYNKEINQTFRVDGTNIHRNNKYYIDSRDTSAPNTITTRYAVSAADDNGASAERSELVLGATADENSPIPGSSFISFSDSKKLYLGSHPDEDFMSDWSTVSNQAYPRMGSNTFAPHVTLLPSGNVGIGTTSPGYKLDVHGTSNVGALTATTGTFSDTVTADTFSGNATTATALETARNINGVSFDGTGNITVNGLNYDVNDSWLRENGDNAHFKQYGNSRQMVFRTDGTTQYASDVGAYPFAWMYGGDASSNRRMLLNTSGQLWCSDYGWLHDKFMARTQVFSDTNSNASFTGQTIDFNSSGSQANTADRVHRALLIDMDSSATGGDTNHEHRMYGINLDVRHSGDSDLVYAMYSYARSDHTSGTTTNLRAGDFSAVASGTGTNTNIYGINSYALKDAGSTGTTASMYGVRGEVEVDAGTCTTAYAFQAHVDRDGGTITTGYLYYGSYAGTVGTKWGIYLTGETKNYFSGSVGIGTTSPGYKLHVSGTSQFDGEMRWSLGTTSHAGYSSNKDWYIRSGASAGKVILQDTGGNVGIGTSNPTAKLHVNGYMKNNNPCFHARSNALRGVGVYIFNVQELDSHNAYNHTNGRFTAPIAGRYVFTVWAISHQHNYMLLEIRKNGSRVYNASPYTSTQLSTVTGTIVINLAVNDYVDVRIGVGTAYGGGNDHNGFCGYMIG
jgi:hypothetical protein